MSKAARMVSCLRTGRCGWFFAGRLMGREELAEGRSKVVDLGAVLSRS
jgi:hypothetical protein